jgi:hypothetical protein
MAGAGDAVTQTPPHLLLPWLFLARPVASQLAWPFYYLLFQLVQLGKARTVACCSARMQQLQAGHGKTGMIF